MTRDDWIKRARELLADREEAAELLAAEPEAAVVVEAEIVEPEELEAEPASKPENRLVRAEAPEGQPRALARRGGRWGRWAPALMGDDEDQDEPELRGSARLLVKAHQLQERGIDHVLDKLEGMGDVRDRLPSVNRSAVWGRK